MANITKRGGTYRIKVSCGYDVNGKQVTKSMTYKPQTGMSEKAIEKELQRQAILFEENCKYGQNVSAVKFQVFAQEWMNSYVELKLKRLTISRYRSMEKRTYAAIGHIRVDKITSTDIQRFVNILANEKFCTSTIRGYVGFVSAILNYAVRKRIIHSNPCTFIEFPPLKTKERAYYSNEEVRKFLKLIKKEPDEKKPFVVFFIMLIYTGVRRGELLALEWKDIDFDNDTISINKAFYFSEYEKVLFTDTPKNKSSHRMIKLPKHVMKTLSEYRIWQDKRREICGASWIETDRLFTKWNGETMFTSTPYKFLRDFCKRVGLRKTDIHSFRHYHASALINSGVDVVTVQTVLGHSSPETTLRVYSHAFNNAQVRAMEAVASVIDLE